MTVPTPQILFVAWQNAESRQIIPVGRLRRLQKGYEFAYIGAVRKAQEHGFEPLVTFPSLETVYKSAKLPPLFSNRLMSASRSDFAEHVSRLALSVDEAEPFTVLARSAGRRETDKLEVFAPPEVVDNTVKGLFLARGVRYISGAEEAAESLEEQASLYVMADVQNDTNSAALALRNAERQILGYVPDYLTQELASKDCPSHLPQVKMLKTNPRPAPIHHRLLCQFEYQHANAPSLFTGTDYEPLASIAAPCSESAA